MPDEPQEITDSDCDELLIFWQSIPGVGLSDADTPEGLSAYFRRNPGLSFVVRHEGRIVAAVLCGHDGRRGYLHHLAVAPEHRRRGIGKSLIERCLARLRSFGIQKCNIFVYADNDDGSGFWRRNGWLDRDDLKVMQHPGFGQQLHRSADTVVTAEQTMAPEYQLEPDLITDDFVDVLRRSTLAQRRPLNEPATIAAMLAHADLIVTARVGGRLVGVSRAITDFAYCTYLSDLAVDVECQRRGIGQELIRRTHQAAGVGTTLILLSAPQAASYYPHIGMTKHESCWITPRSPAPNVKPSTGEDH